MIYCYWNTTMHYMCICAYMYIYTLLRIHQHLLLMNYPVGIGTFDFYNLGRPSQGGVGVACAVNQGRWGFLQVMGNAQPTMAFNMRVSICFQKWGVPPVIIHLSGMFHAFHEPSSQLRVFPCTSYVSSRKSTMRKSWSHSRSMYWSVHFGGSPPCGSPNLAV